MLYYVGAFYFVLKNTTKLFIRDNIPNKSVAC